MFTHHYCHNCRFHSPLPDGWHCEWCLNFFYERGRMPRPGEKLADWSADIVRQFEVSHETLLREAESAL